jgi:hypothetical protein
MCPACAVKRLHEPGDWAQHPYARHGYVTGRGWTHPDLAPGVQAGAAASLRSGEGGDGVAPVGSAAVPGQTVGRTPEWRERLGYFPPPVGGSA